MSPAKILFFVFVGLSTISTAEDRVEFNRDIRPILSENCFYCHGFDEKNRKADLRLDTAEGARADLGGYHAVVAEDISASELVARISSTDPDEIMPPPESEQNLSEKDKALIKRWIEQGAEYQEHWAWQELSRPDVQEKSKGDNAIDAFLEAEWKNQGVTPLAQATPRDRIRRLSFDLRGLPPTIEEVTAFEKDPSEDAFLKLRDRWMSEISYAEHQAVRWLDLVRWADTSGFVSDEPIASGAYRAWIIRAIQQNLPFDQFSIHQLAGDLLPKPTDDQLIASGYNRIVNTNCEAGAIEEEQLYKLKGEHVRALGTVWMGMTTGCAECHDHKFDPFSAKDYYSLGAFFDDLVEAGVYTPGDRREPLHYVHGDKSRSIRDRELVQEIEELRKKISMLKTDGQEAWEEKTRAKLKDNKSRSEFVWIPAQLPAPRILEGSFVQSEDKGKQVRETVAKPKQFLRHHAAELMSGYVHGNAQKTDPAKDSWFVDVWIDPKDRPDMIGLQISQGDYGRLGWRTANYETYFWGDETSGELKEEHQWSAPDRVKRLGDLPKESGWIRLRVPFDQQIKSVSGQAFEAVGMAWLQSGGRIKWGDSGLELRADKVTALELGETAIRKWWETPVNRQVFQSRLKMVAKAVQKPGATRDKVESELAVEVFREQSNPVEMAALRALESELFVMRSQAMPVLVSRRTESGKVTRVLNRGDYNDKSGEVVTAAVPEFLGGKKGNRLDLANWLFSDENPLTARVFVNRLWHQFYGRGISETLEDSGTQGDWPSHLSLLDWLAAEFRESGWDRNHIVRLLTSTRAYRLSSRSTPELTESDPGNRWHARQGRFRLTAEEIRDSALEAAGLLHQSETVPEQSFFPYQPDAYWTRSDKVMFGSRHMAWGTTAMRGQYHRSLYSFWKRQNIHPTMLAFDAPTRQECTAKRNITNTPGQALALLNDPIFVEAARVLAHRIFKEEKGGGDDAKISRGFELALQRQASSAEVNILESLLTTQRAIYRKDPEAAAQLLAIGQAESPSKDNLPELAAWTAVTRAILNLHEFLNRS